MSLLTVGLSPKSLGHFSPKATQMEWLVGQYLSGLISLLTKCYHSLATWARSSAGISIGVSWSYASFTICPYEFPAWCQSGASFFLNMLPSALMRAVCMHLGLMDMVTEYWLTKLFTRQTFLAALLAPCPFALITQIGGAIDLAPTVYLMQGIPLLNTNQM